MKGSLLGALETLSKSNAEQIDIIGCNVPLMIRLFEFVREEVKTDEQIHLLTEKLVLACKNGPIGMEVYAQVTEGTEYKP